MQPDSLIPDYTNPQAWNRYSYVGNNPVNFIDPTGQTGECASDPICSMMLSTFVEAALNMESPYGDWSRPRTPWGGVTGYYSGIGLAKVSDAEMEGKYGELVDKEHRKVGLGLRGKPCDDACIEAMDQADLSVATVAMRIRISMRLDVCVKNGCTSSDMVMVALLAADERITPKDLQVAFNNFKSEGGSVTLDWEKYLESWSKGKDRRKNKQLINRFSENVQKSQPQDFPEIKWDYYSG